MKKLLVTLSFLGTGTIVGAATLPAIVSCAPITHKQMLKQQIEKDYNGIFNGIKNKYDNMSDQNVQSTFMNFVFPENKKMNMTHGYDVMQWNNIVTYTEGENGFERDLIPMIELKQKLSKPDEKIQSKREFLIYDEMLRIMANDFNKYKNIFKGFYERKFISDNNIGETDWTTKASENSTTLDLSYFYNRFGWRVVNRSTIIDETDMIKISRSLPLNPLFEGMLALVVSFKNLSIEEDNDFDDRAKFKEEGMLEWVNKYWEASDKLGFLPANYASKDGTYKDEEVRTSQMDSFRTELFDQEISPQKSKYFHIKHDVNIDEYLDEKDNIENHPQRWMNPKDIIDYFSSIINPTTIYGISNSILNFVKVRGEIIQDFDSEHDITGMNLKFSKYLIDNIKDIYVLPVISRKGGDGDIINNFNRQFGGKIKFKNIYTETDTKTEWRFFSSNQLDLVSDYENVISI